MKVHFWGAAQTTTGSHHLIEVGDVKVALDCGMFQGKRAEANERNREFPWDPADVKAVILSHAHVDHCGNLPTFASQGFRGDIHCTHPTLEISRALLEDSAHIQMKDAQFMNKRLAKKGEPLVQPLYTIEQAQATFPQLSALGMHRDLCFAPRVCGMFLNAGHILGSAVTVLDLEEKGNKHRLVFSGDIGRKKMAILPAVAAPDHAHTLICESTYGNRVHEPEENLKANLLAVVKRTAERGGKIIIPAFSVGRTQEIVFRLNELFTEGLLPRIPIFVDSPLSVRVTDIFRRYPEYYNREAAAALATDPDIFGFETLRYTESVDESKALNDIDHPVVIISASGMCEAGRILHHLRNSISNSKNTILIVGFQAENTLGRRIVEKHPKVRIFGEEHALRAEVVVMNGFSAHADSEELLDYIFHVRERSGGELRRVFLVHGEKPGQEALAERIRDTMKLEVHIPARGDSFELAL